MARKFFSCCAILALMVILLGSAPQAAAKTVSDLSIFKAGKFDAHYVMPNEGQIITLLDEEGIDLSAGTDAAVSQFMAEFAARNPDTPNPVALKKLLDEEQNNGKHRGQMKRMPESPIQSLVVPVEFPNDDTFEWCGQTVTTTGPLHNEVPAPGPRDNNTIWYEDTTPELYNEIYFGVGPNAGAIVNHPNVGEVDLRGYTMANYYLEQSEGQFLPVGLIYPKWLQAAHSEGWYGQDSCSGSNHNTKAKDLVKEVVDAVNADNPSFAWQEYDAGGDGIVDNFTVIHAGMGQEGGGGYQGAFSIWSHASMVDWPSGYLACTAGSAGCPDRNIYVREYSMDPEQIDTGVIAEEYGHAVFGLPDMYTTDYQMSLSNWAIMESGSWNGPLGGSIPAPFPLWFRWLLGWADPVQMDYDAPVIDPVKIGQLSLRPNGTEYGIKINLPDKEVYVPNPLGTGNAWWSSQADAVSFTLTHPFDLTGAVNPILSFASVWSIETDYDYGYVKVSEDNGATWTVLPDMDGLTVSTDSGYGMTGEGQGILRYDLSAYAGKNIYLQFDYTTDVGVQYSGWWIDDITIADGATQLFFDDVEAGMDDWDAVGWKLTPFTQMYPRYYMAEWRNNSGFDEGLKYPYQTVYSDEDEWEVDRAPHTVPGMLLYFRDSSYALDYTLSDSWYDPPSLGPKHGIIVIDSHSWPYEWSNYKYSSGAYVRTSARVQPADATFTLQDTTPFTLRLGYNPATGVYQPAPLETKTFGPRPAVSTFHDSLGYYPGLWYRPATGGLYFWQADASAVVPAWDNYTTRISWLDKSLAYPLFGATVAGFELGTGNPGDSGVQFGVHIAVTGKADDGSWGQVRVWNSPALVDLTLKANTAKVVPGKTLTYTLKLTNTSPFPQTFTVDDPIPAMTTYVSGMYFNGTSIHYEGTLASGASWTTSFVVKVDKTAPVGSVITNTATATDSATGDTATLDVTVSPK